MIKNVLLIRPRTTLHKDTAFFGIGEPLGILYIAAVLEKGGYEVEIFDAQLHCKKTYNGDFVTYGMDEEMMRTAIKKVDADFIGISWFTACNEQDVNCVCQLAKSIHPDTPIAVGGTYPTLFPEKVIENKHIDYVISGEGEYRFLRLINALNENREISLNGVMDKKNKNMTPNHALEHIENLDELPFPARHLIDLKKYEEVNKKYGVDPPARGLITAHRLSLKALTYFLTSKSNVFRIN
jgi:magnesium-protoporphyrin IX monomethyl ester (oxidative) cyclase